MKLKEWYFDDKGQKREQACIKALQQFYDAGKLIVSKGSGDTLESKFGLPYTSSSEYAAIWNCQGVARYYKDPNLMFEGVAIEENDDIVAVFSNKDNEFADWTDIVIGKLDLSTPVQRTIDVPVKEVNYGFVTVSINDNMSPEEIQEKVYQALQDGDACWNDNEQIIQKNERKTFNFQKVLSGTVTIDYNQTMTQDEIIEEIDNVLTDPQKSVNDTCINVRKITYKDTGDIIGEYSNDQLNDEVAKLLLKSFNNAKLKQYLEGDLKEGEVK